MPDQECFVIQYIHRGAPRTVYSVSPASRQRFEALVATLRSCPPEQPLYAPLCLPPLACLDARAKDRAARDVGVGH